VSVQTSLHDSATTAFADLADGRRFAYRRFGVGAGGAVPLLMLHHFRATMDFWDPAVTDGLAASREVILVDNAGLGASTGDTPTDVETMAEDISAFLDALGLDRADVLGFSLGGMVAQPLAAAEPDRVRRVVLVGTGPQGGENMQLTPDVVAAATTPEPGAEQLLYLFYAPTQTSQGAGAASLGRIFRRAAREPMPEEKVLRAQGQAITVWATVPSTNRYAMLEDIRQPVLVVNGHHDIMVPTVNAFILQQHLPDAQLVLYPDSGHGSLFQYPDRFVDDVTKFLDR